MKKEYYIHPEQSVTDVHKLTLKDIVIPESIGKVWDVKMIKGKATIIKKKKYDMH